MKFISAAPLVLDAQKNGYAVPAFNTNGGAYDIARAALEACEETRSPLILQAYDPNLEYRGYNCFVKTAALLCDELEITIPVALQVDHAHTFESIMNGLRAGLTSVMFDASHEPLADNIAQTRKVIEVCKPLGVSVEAEVGYVKGNEPKSETQIGRVPVPEKPTIPPTKTKIAEAAQFVEEAGVDMLAVSVGTTHGVYERQTDIDFALLKELRAAISVPLVQHGTGGISTDDLATLAKLGMTKINFGEPFRYNYIRYFNELTDTMEHQWHPWRIMREVKNRLKDDMKKLIAALGSNNKAG